MKKKLGIAAAYTLSALTGVGFALMLPEYSQVQIRWEQVGDPFAYEARFDIFAPGCAEEWVCTETIGVPRRHTESVGGALRETVVGALPPGMTADVQMRARSRTAIFSEPSNIVRVTFPDQPQSELSCRDKRMDVNGNDQVSVTDALTVLRQSIFPQESRCIWLRSDLDDSGVVTVIDALVLLRAATGLA